MTSMKARFCYCTIILALLCNKTIAQQSNYIQILGQQNKWVDSVYNKLSRRQKIAQLFFVRAHTNLSKAYEDSVANVIETEQIGGVVFFQGGPGRQANLINRYQRLAKVPLLIAQDGEWGLGMRLDSTLSYPYQMTLGAIQDNNLIYKMGQQVAYDFKRLGMQMNFAPDMDVNNNPDNPVINYRSFGDNKYNVAKKGIAYFKGMQDAGLLTTAKHFPGHGDTNVDSHLDLPLLPFTRQRLDSLEEYPFREAIAAGIGGIMIAHMSIPALDSVKNRPSTLSRKIVTGILKDSLRFKGLVVSDAMEMKAVTKYYPDGEAELQAFLAGNDIIELSLNLDKAILKIKRAVRKGLISDAEFEAKVKKVLVAKYWAGLNNRKDVNATGVLADINREPARQLIQDLSDAAVTMVKSTPEGVRINPLTKTAIISIGVDKYTLFQQELARWSSNCHLFMVNKSTPVATLNKILEMLKDYNQVYVSINDTRARPASKLDYSNGVKEFIAAVSSQNNTVTSVFANAYTMAGLPGIEKSAGLLVCYQMSDELQRSAVKVITGQLKPTGKLPVSVNVFFPNGAGVGL
ncbi:glycoside hydrolase family 3 N-terminal domain-containing protein [Mucilaginibacter sp. dw_454]|uniref:glycoside hydrolase family 3 protein n=1 Tax=Mucilaginibacter sp. dw_454 TaxID=2720079 RepID=UPI0021022A21|nr:glycoside hydrolase family 3 N-terminal domain-containing protein [Mucilaginibacter sp. dw_454]